MGKKTTEEKLPLMEFLYRDSELIGSLYSQVFGGDLQGVSQLAGTSEESHVDGGVNLGFANSKLLTKDVINEQIVKNIISKDEKIIDLFSELDIKECKKPLNNYSNGKILKIEGDIYFRNLDTFKNILPLINNLGFIPKNIFSDRDSDETIEMLVDFISNSLPGGLEFELVTSRFEKLNCFIDEKFLINNINNIAKSYTSKYLGKWIVIGIFDNVKPNINHCSSTSGSIRKGIDETEEALFSIVYDDETSFVLKPIIIYRLLNY